MNDKNWNPDVKSAIDDLILSYSNQGNYIVFDFDNTCCIFDTEEQMTAYQIKTMAFEIKPDKMYSVLSSGINNLSTKRTGFGITASYEQYISDISEAYEELWNTYGPFSAKGLPLQLQRRISKDKNWKEFSSKMRILYHLVDKFEPSEVSYPWLTYWFTGMTDSQVYDLALKSYRKHCRKNTAIEIWESDNTKSQTGPAKVSLVNGITVPKNIVRLFKALRDKGFDIWICSASACDVVKAGIDASGLHDYCTGFLGMPIKKNNSNEYICEVDYDTGFGYLAKEDNRWEKTSLPLKTQTHGFGKVKAINNVLLSIYKKGPVAGFMDSSGDFNFCTEFASLKLVVCLNRADRKVTDGAGLIAELAVYEKETLCYNLKKANQNNDILFVLQGRNENRKRSLNGSSMTRRLGCKEEKLFDSEENIIQLKYITENKLSISDAINMFCIKTSKEKSELGFEYGFLESYSGYKNIRQE